MIERPSLFGKNNTEAYEVVNIIGYGKSAIG